MSGGSALCSDFHLPRVPRIATLGERLGREPILLLVNQAGWHRPVVHIQWKSTDPVIQPRAELCQHLLWESRQRVQFPGRQFQASIKTRSSRVPKEPLPKAFIRDQFTERSLH